MPPVEAPTIADVRAARERLAGLVVRTPLVRLALDEAPAEIHLKLECLQPIGSFKIRGATNAMALAGPERLRDGVYTASAGNMAQGVAWSARRLGVAATAVVPEHAPQAKLSALARLGARVEKVPFDAWWQLLVDRGQPGRKELFIHPVSDLAVMAGNGTIGLEILEDLPDVETVLVPYGGGGLSCGIASALRGSGSRARVIACEVDTAAPLSAALAAGGPVPTPYAASFVDGIGGKSVLAEMWPLASRLLDGALSSPLDDVAAAVRLLAERAHVVSEGAGAAPVAAALSGRAGRGKTVCVVSGGNIDARVLARILSGEVP
ncbi:MAG TPA: pyridoxal-phosphate dependent enzyme [Vicinamibacteria bacterium]|nr:pyridoxal-phosphate dependent enzyme [Vicinamibacteria bacterium]